MVNKLRKEYMEKTIKIQRKIIIILGSLTIILSAWLGYWILYERGNLRGNVSELERGAQIDYAYVNKIDEINGSIYDTWQSCNTILTKDLKGEVSDQELLRLVGDYSKRVDTMADLSEELQTLKKNRSDEFTKFEYVKVYKPEE